MPGNQTMSRLTLTLDRPLSPATRIEFFVRLLHLLAAAR
jgi:hypothetical protein